jgi:hypothetical protein
MKVPRRTFQETVKKRDASEVRRESFPAGGPSLVASIAICHHEVDPSDLVWSLELGDVLEIAMMSLKVC